MKVILDNVSYVDKDGERHMLDAYTCDVADDLTTDEEIIEAVAKHIEQDILLQIKGESK